VFVAYGNRPEDYSKKTQASGGQTPYTAVNYWKKLMPYQLVQGSRFRLQGSVEILFLSETLQADRPVPPSASTHQSAQVFSPTAGHLKAKLSQQVRPCADAQSAIKFPSSFFALKEPGIFTLTYTISHVVSSKIMQNTLQNKI